MKEKGLWTPRKYKRCLNAFKLKNFKSVCQSATHSIWSLNMAYKPINLKAHFSKYNFLSTICIPRLNIVLFFPSNLFHFVSVIIVHQVKTIFLFTEIIVTWTKSTIHLLEKCTNIQFGAIIISVQSTQKWVLVLLKLKGKAFICISDFLNLMSATRLLCALQRKEKNLGLPSSGDRCSSIQRNIPFCGRRCAVYIVFQHRIKFFSASFSHLYYGHIHYSKIKL